jgi:hypothetical protein
MLGMNQHEFPNPSEIVDRQQSKEEEHLTSRILLLRDLMVTDQQKPIILSKWYMD